MDTTDITTEDRIKDAARKLFQQKGYAGTRTRDIAEAAGINLALLNYYYRSKEKLFEQIMDESVKKIFFSVQSIIYDEATSLMQKMENIVSVYIEILSENSNLPVFILGEIQANPESFTKRIGLSADFVMQTVLYRQLKTHFETNELKHLDSLQIPLNLLSMIIFPFVVKPVLLNISGMNENQFEQFTKDRKTLIPLWIESMLKIE